MNRFGLPEEFTARVPPWCQRLINGRSAGRELLMIENLALRTWDLLVRCNPRHDYVQPGWYVRYPGWHTVKRLPIRSLPASQAALIFRALLHESDLHAQGGNARTSVRRWTADAGSRRERVKEAQQAADVAQATGAFAEVIPGILGKRSVGSKHGHSKSWRVEHV